ncbi:MAG: bifunctional phosphoglucose/phosphomannose isomerase [Candidatus Woesearchaeota archaeon]
MEKNDFEHALGQIPNQLRKGVTLGQKIEGTFDSIFIIGMGGSALPGLLLQNYISHSCEIPVHILRTPIIPATLTKRSLVFVISFSGNTEETILAYRKIVRKGPHIVVMSSGGKLEQLAPMYKNTYIKIPTALQPRLALGSLFAPIVSTLEQSGILTGTLQEIEEVAKLLETTNYQDYAQELAQKIGERTPLIYTHETLSFIGYRWKIAFNENANTFAFTNTIPELFHNELNALDDLTPYFVIIIKDSTDDAQINEKIEAFHSFVKKRTDAAIEIVLRGNSRLGKLFTSASLADWVSYQMAKSKGIDPAAISVIEAFKK